jgi:Predicted metal-binding integral membrane protein (DUF2182)
MQDENYAREIGALEHLSGRFPEFWMLAVSAVAWLAVAARTGRHIHYDGVAANWWHWMLMVAAMMLPLQIHGVRLTAERSLWERRHRAILGFLLGYLSVWALAGAPLSWAAIVLAIPSRVGWMEGAAIGFLVETAWLISPWKGIAARMCHRTLPLSPAGWRADRDCLGYGWIAGCGCALNCWPLMLVCWLSGHSFIAMILGFGLGWADRHATLDYRLHAMVAAVLGAAFGLFSRVR